MVMLALGSDYKCTLALAERFDSRNNNKSTACRLISKPCQRVANDDQAASGGRLLDPTLLVCMRPTHYVIYHFYLCLFPALLSCFSHSLVSPQANTAKMSKKKMSLESFLKKRKDSMMREQKPVRLPTKRKLRLKKNIKSPT